MFLSTAPQQPQRIKVTWRTPGEPIGKALVTLSSSHLAEQLKSYRTLVSTAEPPVVVHVFDPPEFKKDDGRWGQCWHLLHSERQTYIHHCSV